MVRAIITWSLHNRFIVLMCALALVGVGLYSALNLNIEAYPDPTPPLVEVISLWPGASPEEMERLITIPLETALNGMPGLEYLRSTTLAGLSDIKCQFSYGTDYWAARQEVLNRLSFVDLPGGVTPELSPWSPTGEIVRFVLEGPGYTTNELKAVHDWVINRALVQVPGVIDVTSFGGTVKQYQVLVDTRLMRQYGVSLRQVEEAIAGSNMNIGGDILTMGAQTHNVQAIGLLGGGVDPLDPAQADRRHEIEAEKIDDIQNVIVSTAPDGTPIFVRHVAKVVVGHQPRLGFVGRGDENDVVQGIVMMRRGEQSLPTSRAVTAKIQEIQDEGMLPDGMRLVVFNQRADLVHVTTHNVLHNLFVGISLVILILYVFLGHLTSAAIVAVVIPLALLFALTVLYLTGRSANLLSIGAVDFGIIVDSSVIIVENVYRHLTSGDDRERSRPLIDRIIDASHEVERPLFFSALIIVSAFVPLFAMTGPAGALFSPMAATYAFSILGALLIAVTLTPVLCSYFFHNQMVEKETLLDRILRKNYLRTLRGVLNRRRLCLLLVLGLLIFTAALMPTLGGEFMPELEEGNLWVRAVLPRTVSGEEAARIAPRIRKVIAETPEVEGVISQVGRPDDGTDVTTFLNVEFNVPLKPMDQWREGLTRPDIEAELMRRFEAFPGIDFSFSQYIRDNVDEALSGIKGANSVKLFGSDLEILENAGQQVVESLRSVPGIENVGLFHVLGHPNLEIRIDRRACARYGLNVEDVAEVVQVAIGGRAFSEMIEGEKRFDIVLRLPRDLRNDPENIARIPVDVPGNQGEVGGRIPLSQLAEIEPHKSGASFIYRENNRRYVPIKFAVRDRDLASAVAEARAKVEHPDSGIALPPGYRIDWSGEFAQMQEAYTRLGWMIPLSLTMILMLLYTSFRSFKDSLLVLVNIPVATMGGIWALKLTETPFSISAAVGFISIFGVVVMNGTLLVSYYNQMRHEGQTTERSVVRGSELRLRPVMMTSLAAMLGLLPAAMATSIGSQAHRPLAIVVVGGMFVAMIIQMFLMPILYSFFPSSRGQGTEL